MLPSNIEQEVAEILGKNKGWLRTEECAEKYAKGDKTKRTQFYRWRRKVESGKVKNFQIVKLPGNISFIGLCSADPQKLEGFISEDKRMKAAQSGKGLFGFFVWLERRAKRQRREKIEEEIARLAPIAERYDIDFLKKYVEVRKEMLSYQKGENEEGGVFEEK